MYVFMLYCVFFSYFAFHTVAGHALFYPIFIIINHRVQIPSKVIHAMLAEYNYLHAYIYFVATLCMLAVIFGHYRASSYNLAHAQLPRIQYWYRVV